MKFTPLESWTILVGSVVAAGFVFSWASDFVQSFVKRVG